MDNMENRLKRMKIEETPVDETLRAKTRRAACKARPSMRWVKPVAISAVAVAMTAVMLLTLLPSIASQTQDGDIAAAQQSAAPAQVIGCAGHGRRRCLGNDGRQYHYAGHQPEYTADGGAGGGNGRTGV